MRDQGHLEDTMAHEMVHAYDHVRFKVDWENNLRHAACTEVGEHPDKREWRAHLLQRRLTQAVHSDPSLITKRRVPIHARILHTATAENHKPTPGVCKAESHTVCDGATDLQRPGTCLTDRE